MYTFSTVSFVVNLFQKTYLFTVVFRVNISFWVIRVMILDFCCFFFFQSVLSIHNYRKVFAQKRNFFFFMLKIPSHSRLFFNTFSIIISPLFAQPLSPVNLFLNDESVWIVCVREIKCGLISSFNLKISNCCVSLLLSTLISESNLLLILTKNWIYCLYYFYC